ncbi:ribbon-helix-helix domain-containing protein [Promethearchaeum syntrophicum]|uniref:Ribbon-helix-helix domain-containing protein n=1 Tax=Promethearchaeum syntrophicum TaxID=2594042 RepID=A0A5B9DEI1_9ARCH
MADFLQHLKYGRYYAVIYKNIYQRPKSKMTHGRQKMKNITIALPEIYVRNLEKIQEIGMVPSRSEAIRLAIREFLKKEINNCKLLGFDPERVDDD